MSTEDRSASRASRAEARRRARLAARGELPELEAPDTEEPAPPAARGGFLARMFPPAPPLPNRQDPLAGFSGGALSPITSRLHLLRANPLAWLLPGVAAFPGYVTSFGDRTGVLSLLGTFILFGALIAAGWFGWQRPSLFGVAASFVCFVFASGFVLFAFAQQGAGPETFGATQLIAQLMQGLYLLALGFLGGWYGGYLRRRQTQLSGEQASRRRRR